MPELVDTLFLILQRRPKRHLKTFGAGKTLQYVDQLLCFNHKNSDNGKYA